MARFIGGSVLAALMKRYSTKKKFEAVKVPIASVKEAKEAIVMALLKSGKLDVEDTEEEKSSFKILAKRPWHFPNTIEGDERKRYGGDLYYHGGDLNNFKIILTVAKKDLDLLTESEPEPESQSDSEESKSESGSRPKGTNWLSTAILVPTGVEYLFRGAQILKDLFEDPKPVLKRFGNLLSKSDVDTRDMTSLLRTNLDLLKRICEKLEVETGVHESDSETD